MLKEGQGRDSGDLHDGQRITLGRTVLSRLTFLAELLERVQSAGDVRAFADRTERSAEGIKAVPDRIVSDDI